MNISFALSLSLSTFTLRVYSPRFSLQQSSNFIASSRLTVLCLSGSTSWLLADKYKFPFVPPQRNCLVKTIFFLSDKCFFVYCSGGTCTVAIKVTPSLTLALVGTVVIVSCANWVSLWPSKKQRFGVCAVAISDINRSAAFYSLHCSCRLLLSPSPWSLLLSPPGHALTWSTVDVLLHIELSPSLLYFFLLLISILFLLVERIWKTKRRWIVFAFRHAWFSTALRQR